MRRRAAAAALAGTASLAAAAVLVAAALSPAPAAAATSVAAAEPDECTGLPVCVSVKGPWVRIPAPTKGISEPVEYRLSCPTNRYIIAGTDARTSVGTIAVSFVGATGSPVDPGLTTGSFAVFAATYGGLSPVATSFRPAIGCVPAAGGGGGRSRVSAVELPGQRTLATFTPYKELEQKVSDTPLVRGGATAASLSCAAGGKLVHAAHAVAFRTEQPPAPAMLASVSVSRRIAGSSITVTARTRGTLPFGIRAELQVQAVCTPGLQ